MRGVLFDQPALVAGAEADGVEVVGGSFFEAGVGQIAQPGPCPLAWVRENGFGNIRVVLAVRIVLARGRNVTV